MDPIVVQKLILVHPEGTRTTGAIRIGKPYVVADGEARCPVAIEGLHDKLSDISGEGTLQALMLASRLCHTLLAAFVKKGGRVLYADGDNGEDDRDLDVDLDALFGVTHAAGGRSCK